MLSGSQAIRCIPACVAVEICRFRSSIAASISAGVWLWRSLTEELRRGPGTAHQNFKRSRDTDVLNALPKHLGIAAVCECIDPDTLIRSAFFEVGHQVGGSLPSHTGRFLCAAHLPALRLQIFLPQSAAFLLLLTGDAQFHLHKMAKAR